MSSSSVAYNGSPLVVIRFDRPNVDYQQILYAALNQALFLLVRACAPALGGAMLGAAVAGLATAGWAPSVAVLAPRLERLDPLAGSGGHPSDALGDDGQIIVPFLLLGRRIALLEPVFESSQNADDVFLRHLHRPAQRLVRRSVAPSRFDQGLRPEEQAAGLRAAQELATAVDDEIRAAHQPRARPLDVLGSGIDHDRNAARLDDGGDLFEPDTRRVFLLAEQHDHRHRFGQSVVEVITALDLDDLAADHPHCLVIGEALAFRDDDSIDHTVGER